MHIYSESPQASPGSISAHLDIFSHIFGTCLAFPSVAGLFSKLEMLCIDRDVYFAGVDQKDNPHLPDPFADCDFSSQVGLGEIPQGIAPRQAVHRHTHAIPHRIGCAQSQ